MRRYVISTTIGLMILSLWGIVNPNRALPAERGIHAYPAMSDTLQEDTVNQKYSAKKPSVSVYKREDILNFPGMVTVSDLFQLESGAVTVGEQPDLIYLPSEEGRQLRIRDQSLTSLHLRGGRSNQVQYLIEGSPVTNPLYGGRNLLDLSLTSLDSVTLFKGVAPVRFGHAQSGVVNMHLREHPRSFRFETRYKMGSGDFGGDFYGRDRLNFFAGDIFADSDKFDASLSGGFDLSETPYSMGFSSSDYSVLGIPLNGRQENESHLNASAEYQFLPDHSIELNYNGYWSQWREFSWLFKNYPGQLTHQDRQTHHLNLSYSYNFDLAGNLKLSYSHLSNQYDVKPDVRRVPDYWRNIGTDSMYSVVDPPRIDPETGFIDSGSIQDMFQNEEVTANTFQGHYTTRWFNDRHRLQAGFGLHLLDLDLNQIYGGATTLSPYGLQVLEGQRFEKVLPPPAGAYSYFGYFRSMINTNPERSHGYFQYQLKMEDIRVRAGLRLDRFDRGGEINHIEYRQKLKKVILEFPKYDFSDEISPLEKFDEVTTALSPRVTVTYPGDQTSFYFSYGHFNQMPELHYLFRTPYAYTGFIGNPSLDYIQTETFEFGFGQSLSQDINLTFNAYYKDVNDLPKPQTVNNEFGLDATYMVNDGQSQIWGAEFSTAIEPSKYWKFNGQYTIQWAQGNRIYNGRYNLFNTHNQNYYLDGNDFPRPVTDRPLSWNRRHQVVVKSRLISPADDPLHPLGLQLPGNWNLSIIWRYDSGSPYTPFSYRLNETLQQWNQSTTDYRMRTDLKFTKGFNIKPVDIQLFIEMINIFEQQNVNPQFGFNSNTGKPFEVGDIDPATNEVIDFGNLLPHLDPRRYHPGFQMQVGMQIGF